MKQGEYDFRMQGNGMDIQMNINERTLKVLEKLILFVKDDLEERLKEIEELEAEGIQTIEKRDD